MVCLIYAGLLTTPNGPAAAPSGDDIQALGLLRPGIVTRCEQIELVPVIAEIKAALEITENRADTYFLVALCTSIVQNQLGVIDSCTAALEVDPFDFVALSFRAKTYKKIGDVAHALQDVEACLRQSPKDEEMLKVSEELRK